MLGGSEDLPPLCARPPQLRNSATHGLRHATHGICVLLALLLQLAVLEPLVERPGVHELLVPLAHRVEAVGGVLLPELPQHLLLVPRLDAHHGSLMFFVLSQNSMVFRVSSSSKRSARETCLMALIMAGLGSGSGACSGSTTGAGTGAAARSGARSTVGGGGLGLFLLPGGLPLPRFFGSGAAAGSAAGGASSLAAAGSAATSSAGRPGCASASGAGASSMAFFLQAFFQFVVRPSSSPVQVDAEAQAGAAQVDHVALVVGELEAQVPQRDRAPDVDHVVLVSVGLHDVAHALLADDLGDDVVAQRPHRVGRVGQAAAAKVDLRVAVVGHLQLVARLHVSGAGEVAADPGGQVRAGVGARGQLGPVQRAERGVLPVQVGAAVGAQEGVGHPDLEDAQAGGALQVHRLAHVELEVGVGARHAPAAVHPDGRHGLFLPTKEPPRWAGQARDRGRRVG